MFPTIANLFEAAVRDIDPLFSEIEKKDQNNLIAAAILNSLTWVLMYPLEGRWASGADKYSEWPGQLHSEEEARDAFNFTGKLPGPEVADDPSASPQLYMPLVEAIRDCLDTLKHVIFNRSKFASDYVAGNDVIDQLERAAFTLERAIKDNDEAELDRVLKLIIDPLPMGISFQCEAFLQHVSIDEEQIARHAEWYDDWVERTGSPPPYDNPAMELLAKFATLGFTKGDSDL